MDTLNSLTGMVRRCVDDYNMISPGDRIAVGISGGKDSLVLLAALSHLKRYYPAPFELEAITIDAGFEGMDFSAFNKAEDFSLYFRPYTRNTTVWEDALQQKGAFLDPWQDPSDAALMEKACDNAQKIIEDAIAAE